MSSGLAGGSWKIVYAMIEHLYGEMHILKLIS